MCEKEATLFTRTILSVAIATLLSIGTARADPLVLDPNATNNGLGTLDSVANAGYPFATGNSTDAFTALLTIPAAPGSNNTVSASETGSFLITTFSLQSGGPSNITNTYNLYADFSINGTGSFGGSSIFTFNPASLNVSATLMGSPGSNSVSGLNFVTPTSANPFGVDPGSKDFVLGNGALDTSQLAAFVIFGSCANGINCNGSAITDFNAAFNFTPAAGTFGLDGFFQNLDLSMLLNLSSQEGGPTGATFETYNGVDTNITVAVASGTCTGTTDFTGQCGAGGGSLTYDVAAVPEPGSLSILGAALIGLAALSRRRRRQPLADMAAAA
jgi:PEP-CTERM motif